MKEVSSTYYPPRAKWYSRFRCPWYVFKRALRLERLRLPGGVPLGDFCLSLVLPGRVFVVLGQKKLGWAMCCVYFVAAGAFFAWIGCRASALALGLMLSAHVTSVVHLLTQWLEGPRLRTRVILALATLVVLYAMVYSPLRELVETRLAMPLRVEDNVVVVKPGPVPASVKPGARLAYRIDPLQRDGAMVSGGFGLGPALAVAGDRVSFADQHYEVNGVAFPRLPHMPVQGEWVVPEKCWFIWPRADMMRRGNVTEATVSGMLFQVAMVSENQYLGRPYRHWFGRRQIAP